MDDAQRQHFHEKGFIVVPAALDADHVARLNELYDRAVEEEVPQGRQARWAPQVELRRVAQERCRQRVLRRHRPRGPEDKDGLPGLQLRALPQGVEGGQVGRQARGAEGVATPPS